MVGAKEGSCKAAGFEKMVKQVEVQPAGSPMKMTVTVMGRDTTCHCHSYEEIACSAAGDALYVEHIDEIVAHCAGVIDGTDAMCPYKCFQPFEVLHLYYLECSLRPVDATYLKINATAKCHKAAPSSSDTACVEATQPTTTTLQGSMKFDITLPSGESASDFIQDANVKKGVEEGIATKLGVPATSVEATLSVERRLGSGRRLSATSIKVDYTITTTTAQKNSVQSLLSEVETQKTQWSSALQSSINTKTGKTYTVAVTSAVAPGATTTEAPAISVSLAKQQAMLNIIFIVTLVTRALI